MRKTHISMELANEAGEITVLEEFRKQVDGELITVPNNEAISCFTPRNHRIK